MKVLSFIKEMFKKKVVEVKEEVKDIVNLTKDQVNADIQKHVDELIEISSIQEILVQKLAADGIKVDAKDISVVINYNPE